MNKLGPAARAYILSTCVVGVAAAIWAFSRPTMSTGQLEAFLVLTVAAAVAQLFTVTTPRNQSYSTAPSFLFAAVLLLDETPLVLCVITSFLLDWIKSRYPWYMQSFNISASILQALASKMTLRIAESSGLDTSWQVGGVVLLAATVFAVTNHAMLACVLRFARRVSFRASGLFTVDNLVTEVALMCLGGGIAILWGVNPWLFVLGASPLVLIHRSLVVPTLKEEASVDPKTGLYNMKRFREAFAEELQRAERFGRPLSIVMADLDFLRTINNTYGHLAGDIVLRGVADIIRREVRDYDVPARFGGEEFAILLPETEIYQAEAVAERIRQRVEESLFVVPTSATPIRATLSLGIAACPRDARTADELIHEADLAVYWSKLNGRNQIQLASPEIAKQASKGMTERKPNWEPLETKAVLGEPARAGEQHPTQPTPAATPQTSSSAAPPLRASVRRKRDVGWPNAIFIVGVAAVGLIGLLLSLLALLDANATGIAVFVVFAALAELFALNLYQRGRISISFIAILAAGFLWGMPAAVLAAAAAAITSGIRARSRLERVAFNLGTLVLAGASSATVFHQLAHVPATAPSALGYIPLLLATLAATSVNFVLNIGLVAIAMARTERLPLVQVWRERFSWLLPHYPLLGLVALAIALAYTAFGPAGLAIYLAPSFGLRLALRQFVERTNDHIVELRQAKERLAVTSAELDENQDRLLAALFAGIDSAAGGGQLGEIVALCEELGRAVGLDPERLTLLVRAARLTLVSRFVAGDDPGERAAFFSGFMTVPHLRPLARLAQRLAEHDVVQTPLDADLDDPDTLEAQVFAIAEAYSRLQVADAERLALEPGGALRRIEAEAGTRFHPKVVDALARLSSAMEQSGKVRAA